jgi:L-ascorbate metabolism protein UlaG (beta-lactamase superfamily)
MKGISPDIALIPVSGTYVMTVQEAVEATDSIKPKIAIPMHYDAIVGSAKDADEFKKRAKCDVKILQKEE